MVYNFSFIYILTKVYLGYWILISNNWRVLEWTGVPLKKKQSGNEGYKISTFVNQLRYLRYYLGAKTKLTFIDVPLKYKREAE